MDGRRDGPGHPRWSSAPRPPAPSEKPVSSYASLACGPPPSYARQGSGGSWDYDDKPQRPSSPISRGMNAPYYPSRGGGGGGGGGGRPGRYDNNDRFGGRGRTMRGGRDRNDRIDRFSSGGGGQHRNSPDRFQNSLDRGNGYEAGEILPSQRLGSIPGPGPGPGTGPRRLDDSRPFEGRGGGRGADMDGRGSGRYIPRGGGRDGGRGGRGPRTFGGSGRFVDRGGRGGRADFRGRRGGDGRDAYSSSKDWVSPNGRPSPEEPSRVLGGLDTPRNDDGPRFFPSDSKNEPMSSRGDDRIPPPSRPYDTNIRDQSARGPVRYSSLASSPEVPPRKMDPHPDDRFVKRRREDEDFPADFDEKRSRSSDYVPRSRHTPSEERFAPVGTSRRPLDDGPGNFESRAPSRPSEILERRGIDSRGAIDRPPIRDDPGVLPPTAHEERRPRMELSLNSDVRARPGTTNEGPYDSDPSLRGNRRPGMPNTGSELRLDRTDTRAVAPPGRGDIRGRFVPPREDSRPSMPTSSLRDENHSGPPPVRHLNRPDLPENRERDPRLPLDGRPRDPRDAHMPRPSPVYDARETSISKERSIDRFNEVPPPPERIIPRSDIDNRPQMGTPTDRGRDMRSVDFRGRQPENDHNDNRLRGPLAGRIDAPKIPPPNASPISDAWAPHSQHSAPKHSYDPPPHSGNRGNWNAPQGSRSPIPSPISTRGTVPPSMIDQSISIPDPGISTMPMSYGGRGAPLAEGRDFMADRGRGRGRGFRGMGRGRSDFGRFSSSGRGPVDYGHPPQGKDLSLQPREGWKRYPGAGSEGERLPDDSPSSKVDDRESPKKQPEENQNESSSGGMDVDNNNVSVAIPDQPESEPVLSQSDEVKQEGPRPVSPPPKGEPSGVMKALVRLIDLEASMEYAYAKHMQLVKKQDELKAQAVTLSGLPVGMDALKEDIEAMEATDSIYHIE